MSSGQQFRFVVEQTIIERIERVVMINDGRVVSKERKDKDMIYTVERT